ncbi:IS3 family transposase [Chitinophaga sp. 212800010-3]|uniref:IS3 family transposase n=1 Tax=unclassified Chitinophaga TaxID=2619133 RepID=UPI003FA42F38
MDKRIKYSLAQKQIAVKSVLSGHDTFSSAARKIGGTDTTIHRWVNLYKLHGQAGLQQRPGNYTGTFKFQVLQYMFEKGLSLMQTAMIFGITQDNIVGRWLKKYEREGAAGLLKETRGRKSSTMTKKSKKSKKPVTDPTQAKLAALEAELLYLRAENAYLKKLDALIQEEKAAQGSKQAARAIRELRPHYSLELLLKVAGMARSTYYYYLKQVSVPDKHAILKGAITALYHQHKGRYGYRRITAALRRSGREINHKTVLKMMRACNLKSLVRVKKYRSYKGQQGRIAPNLLKRDFKAEKPCQKWVTDVTMFVVGDQKLYLSPIMDLYNGEIVSYSLSERSTFQPIIDMLQNALPRLPTDSKLILHSDQGWQYQMKQYQKMLIDCNIEQSMSGKGNCLDNAAMESFFSVLKTELFYLEKFDSITVLKQQIEEYIGYYNNDRIKLKLNGLSPVNYRTQAI